MLDGMKVLALVPARAGSKRLPRKNVRMVAGEPMFVWSAYAAARSGYVDHTVVSTDDRDLERLAIARGIHVIQRPGALATDEATTAEVIVHTLDVMPGFDILVLLQPTSPLRTETHINGALEELLESGAESVVSVRAAMEAPQLLRQVVNGVLESALPTATQSPLFALNGAVFVSTTEALRRVGGEFGHLRSAPFVMDPADSIDVDLEGDLRAARKLMRKRSHPLD